MIDDTPETSSSAEKFDNSAFPENTLFHERRERLDRRNPPRAEGATEPRSGVDGPMPAMAKERRARKERRRRIDPTTFEKQYTEDELEFMNAMQQFKVQSCKTFPTCGEVLQVAFALGYRKLVTAEDAEDSDSGEEGPASVYLETEMPIDLGISRREGASR